MLSRNGSVSSMKKKKYRIIIILLVCVCIAGTAIFITSIIKDFLERGQGKSYYSSLSAYSGSAAYQHYSQSPPAAQASGSSGFDDNGGPDEVGSDGSDGNDGNDENAELAFVPAFDFDAIRAECPDVIAWIYVEDTVIDYPIVQGGNNQYYLEHLPNGEKNKTGSIFMDCSNAPGFTDEITYLFGHHMKNGEMFATLQNYTNQQYFENHRFARIFTPYENFDVEFFAGYIVEAAKEYPPYDFAGEDEFYEYIKTINRRSVFKCDEMELSYGDCLVSLITCNYNVSNGRLILVGKIL